MVFTANFNIKSSSTNGTAHSFEAEVDLQGDLRLPRIPGQTLEESFSPGQVGLEVVRFVAENLVPEMVSTVAPSGVVLTEEEYHIQGDIRRSSKIKVDRDGADLNIFSKNKMNITVSSDRPMSSAEALIYEREGIAASMAEGIITSIQDKLLNREYSETKAETKIKMENDRVTEYTRTVAEE